MTTIKKVAVLGSGVMGSGIAAHIANSGTPVVLLDIVPEGATSRNVLTEKALEKMLSSSPAMLTHKNKAKLITIGNLEDDLNTLKDVDWIIEAVLEKREVKQAAYKKINAVRKKGSVVSSNTSTLPLHTLTEGLGEEFARDFMITHFFNPPRYMRLLEVLAGPQTREDAYEAIKAFGDAKLGKGLVVVKDTPGFIANRIGVYWLMVGLLDAIRLGIRVEEADAVMGKPAGIPKTGVFGLFDLIGIDLMPLIAKAMLDSLPASDPFRVLYTEPELVKKMIAEGYTGRKGKGGFYRLNKEGGKKIKEAINLQTGDYGAEKKAALESVEAGKSGLYSLVTHSDIGGRYAKEVLIKTLHYAACLIPEISDTIVAVDEAMRLGYNWKYGPFELIDRLKTKDAEGTTLFAAFCKELGLSVPAIIEKAAGKPLYRIADGKRQYFDGNGAYQPISEPPGVLLLSDVKLAGKPILKNGSASLWDVGDGIACFEITSKMNSIDPDVFTLLEQSTEWVKNNGKGLIIGSDAENFSVGANLAFFLMCANIAAYTMISDTVKQGQRVLMGLKYAPFPVVSALSGMALGGGCEINLHADAVQAHVESYPGLVEVGVGVIPGWGGCKEMLLRHVGVDQSKPQEKPTGFFGGLKNVVTSLVTMPAISKAFEQIIMAKVATSAEEARDLKLLNQKSRISMNRARVLADAKALCLELAKDYTPPHPVYVSLPGKTGRAALMMAVEGFVKSGKATPHDAVIAKHLAYVLTGGDTDMTEALSEQQLLDLEHEAFMELVHARATLDRIQHMLDTGKPLRN